MRFDLFGLRFPCENKKNYLYGLHLIKYHKTVLVIWTMETEITADRDEMELDLAGAGSRFISCLIDFFIQVVIGLFFLYISISSNDVTVAIMVASLYEFFSVAYFTYFFGNGQTPGMMAMKIKLIGTDGTYPVGYGKGILRMLGMIVSAMVIYLGFFWILIDKENQGWHDKIAGTYVVKV